MQYGIIVQIISRLRSMFYVRTCSHILHKVKRKYGDKENLCCNFGGHIRFEIICEPKKARCKIYTVTYVVVVFLMDPKLAQKLEPISLKYSLTLYFTSEYYARTLIALKANPRICIESPLLPKVSMFMSQRLGCGLHSGNLIGVLGAYYTSSQ